jgi:SAM-dependent methyltransferase
MSQVTHGIRALLSNSRIYDLFQELMGSSRGRTIFTTQYVRAKTGERVLDVGCGTGEILALLPGVEYFGFDPHAGYIAAAQDRFRDRAGSTFRCATLDGFAVEGLGKFDIVLAIGVLHHLTDQEALQLLDLARAVLRPGGRLVTLDPCFAEGQSPIARYLVSRDRGRHVRTSDAYRKLASAYFPVFAAEVRHDIARFPYTHFVMECTAA